MYTIKFYVSDLNIYICERCINLFLRPSNKCIFSNKKFHTNTNTRIEREIEIWKSKWEHSFWSQQTCMHILKRFFNKRESSGSIVVGTATWFNEIFLICDENPSSSSERFQEVLSLDSQISVIWSKRFCIKKTLFLKRKRAVSTIARTLLWFGEYAVSIGGF